MDAIKPELVGDYVALFKKDVVTDPAAKFDVTATFDGKRINLSGETSERKYHDQLIDMLVAMKLFDIPNEISFRSEELTAECGAAGDSSTPDAHASSGRLSVLQLAPWPRPLRCR